MLSLSFERLSSSPERLVVGCVPFELRAFFLRLQLVLMSEDAYANICKAITLDRIDILQSVLASFKSETNSEELSKLLSSGRKGDKATPLHLAAFQKNADAVRALLVSVCL